MYDSIPYALVTWSAALFGVVAAFACLTAAVTVLKANPLPRYTAVGASVASATLAGHTLLAAVGATPRDAFAVTTSALGCMVVVSLVVCCQLVAARRYRQRSVDKRRTLTVRR